MPPIYRKLENDDWVVDFGRKWFRISTAGTITIKEAKDGHVETRSAGPVERAKALKLLNQHLAK
jgi:hypothetical protein